MPYRFAVLLSLLIAGAVTAQERNQVTVGSVTAARGVKATGIIAVPAGIDQAAKIPVAVIHGSGSGPVLALVAGSHGTEYASIVALEKLIELLDPAAISGTVIILPLVNTTSFEQKIAHINPVDGKNMNRTYPGRLEGTLSERACYMITKEVVEKCDHLIDFHGGDLDESLRPYSYWTKTGNVAQDRTSKEMVLAFGLDHIIVSTDRPKDPNASRYLENTASTRGKPSITVEAGHTGTVEPEDVEALIQGTFSVMRYLKMLAGSPSPVEKPVWILQLNNVMSEVTGIFYPLVQRGAYVAQGAKIGYVTDYVGKKIFEARSPAAGIIMYIRGVPSLTQDETIASVGEPGPEP